MTSSEATDHLNDLPAEKPILSVSKQVVSEIEQQDIAQALAGISGAFARIIDRYQAEVAAQMWRYSRDHNVHEELVQNVFVEVYRSLSSFRQESPLLHWIRKIGVRVGYRYWKEKDRKKEKVSLSDVDYDFLKAGSERAQSSEQAGNLLHSVLEQLPARDRMILTLIYWDEYSMEEAAEITGWSQSLVKVQAFRARKKLKKLLQEKLSS